MPLAPQRLSPRPSRAVAGLLAALLAGACCATPRAEEYLEAGFQTPDQTIRAFQLGMRADLPSLEFRCLAVEFVERHRISELAYREFRKASGWVRYGVARARIEGREELGPDRVRLSLATSGPLGSFQRRFEVDLVRETFWQAWSGEDLLADELAGGLGELLGVVDGPGGPLLVARLALPPHLDPREGASPITGVRVGHEWKIADLRDPQAEPSAPAAAAPPRPSP